MTTTAKLFTHERSQAVRLPEELRLRGTEVRISREGERIILEPLKPTRWPPGFWDLFTPDPDFEVPSPLPAAAVDLDDPGDPGQDTGPRAEDGT